MRFSILLLLLYVMCVQSCSITFYFYIWISIGFCLVILHGSLFVILSSI
jgi:hypothetical protein